MQGYKLTREEVGKRCHELPAFPSVVSSILATLDDPDATTEMLVAHITHDPVIAARVISLANAAATQTRRKSPVVSISIATSLIGTNRVREMAITSSIAGLFADIAPAGMAGSFCQHSVAVGVCSEELTHYTSATASSSAALVAGLLHDVGQLWLSRFHRQAMDVAWGSALTEEIGIEVAERERFGVDHSTIGAWLAEEWSLPVNIVAAIRHHHAPDPALAEPLVPLVHVAEVLSNALDLATREENRVTAISSAACQALDLTWNDGVRPLLGRMEARSNHANAFFHGN